MKITNALWLQHAIINFQPSTMKFYKKMRNPILFKCVNFSLLGFFHFSYLTSVFILYLLCKLSLVFDYACYEPRVETLDLNFFTFVVYMLDVLEGFFSKPKMLKVFKVFKVSIRSTTPI